VLFVGLANLAVFAYGLCLWFADGRPLRFSAAEARGTSGALPEMAN
jgi:hypothetical protein